METPIGPALPRRFYQRPAPTVARELLGKVIVHRLAPNVLAGRIVETEAYLGEGDQAAHSAAGRTERTRVLFGPGGHAYVYLSYGVHHCLNFSAEKRGAAGCVLIRALEPLEGLEEMERRRPRAHRASDLASGPGKLTQALGITLKHYGLDITRGALTVRQAPEPEQVRVSRRIGITKSVELPLRFWIDDNEHVSVR